jgi:RNA polymerase sigma factor for flagellar operon FliA
VYLSAHRPSEEDAEPIALEDPSSPNPEATLIGEELREKLAELVAALPEEARALIQATYYEGLTLQEAGRRLGVSKSWASRLHAKTLKRLARGLRSLGVAP